MFVPPAERNCRRGLSVIWMLQRKALNMDDDFIWKMARAGYMYNRRRRKLDQPTWRKLSDKDQDIWHGIAFEMNRAMCVYFNAASIAPTE